MNTYSAILSLVPNAKFAITDKDYSKIEWFDERDLPSKPDVEAEIDRLSTEEPKRLLRVERDKRLTDSDWVVTKAFETGGGVPESWKTYRQALRDITISTQSIFSVTWPTEPS